MSASAQPGLQNPNLAAQPRTKKWLLPAFIVGGLLMSLGVVSLADHYPTLGAPAVAGIMFVAILAGIAGMYGALLGARKLVVFSKQLVWWHWMWLLIACSALVFRFARDTTEVTSAPIDAWALLRLGPEAIVFVVLILRLVLRKPNWLPTLFTGLPKWFAIFGLICLTTTMWSVYAAWTFYKSVEILFDIGLVAAIIASVNSIDAYSTLLDWTWLLYGAELVSAWLSAVLWPADAFVNGRLEGVFPIVPYNAVGETGSLLCMIAICRLFSVNDQKKDWAWNSALLAFGTISLFYSQTRNAMGGLLVGTVIVFIVMRKWGTIALGAITAAAALLFTGLGPAVWTYLQRDQTEEQMMSLTGRMDWWRFAWEQFLQHPFTGLGAYAAGKFAVLAKLHLNNGAIHSDFMEIIVGTGIWGVFPVLVALLGTWWYLIRAVRNPLFTADQQQLAVEGIGVMGILTVHSVFNVELIWHAPLLFLVVLGYAEMIRRRMKTARESTYSRRWAVGKRLEPAIVQ